MINNIIFDMDGTLTNTALVSVAGCRDAAPLFGLEPRDPEFIKSCIGWANPEFYYILYPDADKELLARYAEEVERIERRLMRELKKDLLFDGMERLLGSLLERGYDLYIASAGDTLHVDTALRNSGIFPMFKAIHCNDGNKENLLLQIVESNPRDKYIMVGDKSKDALAAKACGITSVGVEYGYGSREEKDLFDYLIESPSELVDILERKGRYV